MSETMPGAGAGVDRRLVANAFSNYVALAANMLCGLLITSQIAQGLGEAGFGAYTIVMAFGAYLSLLDCGVSDSLMRHLATDGREAARAELLATGWRYFGAVALVSTTAGVGALLCSLRSVDAAPEVALLGPAQALMGLTVGAQLLFGHVSAALRSRERYALLNALIVGKTVARLAATTALLSAGAGLLGAVGAILAADGAALGAGILLERDGRPRTAGTADLPTLRRLLGYGLGLLLLGVATTTAQRAGVVIGSRALTLAEVGHFGIVITLFGYVTSLVTSATGVLLPRLSSLEGSARREELLALNARTTEIVSAVAVLGCLLGALFVEPFLRSWLGAGMADAAAPFRVVLAASSLIFCQAPLAVAVMAVDRHRRYAAIAVVEAALVVALSLLLVGRMGVPGLALGMAIPMALCRGVAGTLYACRAVGTSLQGFLMLVAPAYGACAAALVVHLLVAGPSAPADWRSALTAAPWVAISYLASLAVLRSLRRGAAARGEELGPLVVK